MKPPYTESAYPAAPSPQNNVILGHKNRNVSFRMRVVLSLLCAKEHVLGTILHFGSQRCTRAHYKKVSRILKAPKTINHYHKEDFFFIMVENM